MVKPPISPKAMDALAEIVAAPVPCQEINSGIVHKLEDKGFGVRVDLPSPYRTVKGTVAHLKITDAGLGLLARWRRKWTMMRVKAYRGIELWMAKRMREGRLPALPTDPKTRPTPPGEGFPILVTRSLNDFPFACEWRWEGEYDGIQTVEPFAIRLDVRLALESLGEGLRYAEALEAEAVRLGWTIPENAEVLGEVLAVGEDRYVIHFVLRALRALPDHGLVDVDVVHLLPTWDYSAPILLVAEQDDELAGNVYAVRRDGVVVCCSPTGQAVVHTSLPPTDFKRDLHASGIPGWAFCQKCNWPHPDRPTCP